jgi:membrane protein DedA with SNARE-associated domain
MTFANIAIVLLSVVVAAILPMVIAYGCIRWSDRRQWERLLATRERHRFHQERQE